MKTDEVFGQDSWTWTQHTGVRRHVFDCGHPSKQLFQGRIRMSLDLLSEEVLTVLEGSGPLSPAGIGAVWDSSSSDDDTLDSTAKCVSERRRLHVVKTEA